MGGIQRRRRRLRHQQPVTERAAEPTDALSTDAPPVPDAVDPAPPTEPGAPTPSPAAVRSPEAVPDAGVGSPETAVAPGSAVSPEGVTAPESAAAPESATAKPHPPRPHPPAAHGVTITAPQSPAAPHRPSPHDIAELAGAFALTANVQDPEPGEPEPHRPVVGHVPDGHDQHHDDLLAERGLRGLVGGGASQVSVSAAMRARDAARPSAADLEAAERDLPIVRRGWVPREDLPRPGRR